MRIRRQSRYDILRKSGFTDTEARPLSKIPSNVPYLFKAIKERVSKVSSLQKQGVSNTKIRQMIADEYTKKGYTRKTNGRVQIDPWKLIKEYEKEYKNKQPAYNSPWERNYRGFKDFAKKYEKTVGGQGYRI